MKAKRFSEAQIVAILNQQQTGLTVAQIIRQHGISEATFYNWNGAARAEQVWGPASGRCKTAQRP